MGCYDIFCCICGNPLKSLSLEILLELFLDIDINKNEIIQIAKNIKWLDNCTLLLKNNKIIHHCKEIMCNIGFKSLKTNKFYESIYYYNNNIYLEQYATKNINYIENIGIVVHTDCWKFIQKNYNINLEYKDLPIFLSKKNINSFLPINYKNITKYWLQNFDYIQMYLDNNIYMIESPLGNNIQNINRIKKNINQIKLKKNRKGPSVSATFYQQNDIKLGNNKKFWKISNGKWKELNEIVINKKIIISNNNKYIKYINNIPQIGEINKKPIFIKNYKYDNKTKTIIIDFIGTNNTILEILNNCYNIKN